MITAGQDLARQWDLVGDVVRRVTGPLGIASVDADGGPTITPIGTVFLRDDCTGVYFDQYTESLLKTSTATLVSV